LHLQAAFAAGKRAAAPFVLDELARRQAEKLPYITLQPKSITVVSAGYELSVALLQARYPQAEIRLVAASAAHHQRLAAARSPRGLQGWLGRLGRSRTAYELLAGQPTALPLADASTDLLWADLSAMWWGSASSLLTEWQRVVRPGGFVMFAALGPDTGLQARAALAHQREPVREAIDIAALLDMHDWGDALVHTGWSDPVMDMEKLTLTYAEPLKLLRELSALVPSRPLRSGLQPRRRLAAVMQLQMHEGERYPLTVEAVYGHAFKVHRQPRADGVDRVSVDQLAATLPSRKKSPPDH
jgi:malonyl-CoA O-methyltransferase